MFEFWIDQLRMEFVFNSVITNSELVVELQRHGTVRRRSSSAQGSGNQ
jgi:hypothetical protein